MIRILLPVDGSKIAERAARHVIAMARSSAVLKVLLLNVQPPWAPARSEEERLEGARLHARAAKRATRGAESLLVAAGVACESRMRVGDPARVILAAARQERCDTIVMGTRGRGAIAGLVLGSVAMKVVQLARVPVTLVR
jgi:nucleotide-binding universal stress UspA family protein